ncbi:MAG: DUF3237 domain-containing protein [Rhodocyclaceae bacterium]|jgi:hypothetical protein|nr:DUF3237 domain-containing protein [Rhodocyclaceae bacterium]
MLQFEPLMELAVDVGELVTMGEAPQGERRVVAILGGMFAGARLRGAILPGADWQLARRDGVLEIDARYALRAEDGGIVQVLSQGYRHGPPEVLAALGRGEAVDPSTYFFRTVMRFETGHAPLAWLNRTLAVASGERRARQVLLQAYALR